jgi:hypothetical protein
MGRRPRVSPILRQSAWSVAKLFNIPNPYVCNSTTSGGGVIESETTTKMIKNGLNLSPPQKRECQHDESVIGIVIL